MAAESRLQRVQTDLFSAQGEMASGMIDDFTINPDLVGIAIGKKGARIKQVEKDTGVSSVNVDGKTGTEMYVLFMYVLFVILCLQFIYPPSLLPAISYTHLLTTYHRFIYSYAIFIP